AGESLWAIARRCNTTVAALKAANGLTSDALQIGDRLKVPAARVGAASAPAAAAPPPARPVVAPSRDAAGVGLARDIIATGMQYLGVDYDYGGASPSGFDCSGFIMYICKQHGVNLPHSSRAMSGMGTPVARSELQPGDLVFFRTLGSSSINHVGMYVGN
ncbi:MAG: peptidoglycan endopeptidase, partial [Syntrophomonadaceae bacterium]|nr:peptidoglycan endopeptidase [Syntrophomonadaceae bacterium]